MTRQPSRFLTAWKWTASRSISAFPARRDQITSMAAPPGWKTVTRESRTAVWVYPASRRRACVPASRPVTSRGSVSHRFVLGKLTCSGQPQ
jgi:hypothetical protein